MVHDKCPNKESLRYVAMKIQKSSVRYREAAYDEIALLKSITENSTNYNCLNSQDFNVVELLDHFEHNGQHGRHVCMVFEVLGENLLSVIKKYNYKGVPIRIVKNFTRQMLVGLDYLHRFCKIIHTDLKPENILIAESNHSPDPDLVSSILSGEKNIPKVLLNESETKFLSSEQKKKAKKKLKKKRQIAAKKGQTMYSDSIPSPDQLLEMQLMEMASEPISSHLTIDTESSRKLLSDEYPSRNSSNSNLLDVNDQFLWLRRSLFSDLNFILSNSSSRSTPNNIVFKHSEKFKSLPFDFWESPDEKVYAKLTMVN